MRNSASDAPNTRRCSVSGRAQSRQRWTRIAGRRGTMNRPLSEGEKRKVLDTLAALISEHVAKLSTLEDEVGETRDRLTTLRLLSAQLSGASARDGKGTESEGR